MEVQPKKASSLFPVIDNTKFHLSFEKKCKDHESVQKAFHEGWKSKRESKMQSELNPMNSLVSQP